MNYQIVSLIVFGTIAVILAIHSKKIANQEWRLKDIIFSALLSTLFGAIALATVLTLIGPAIPILATLGLLDFGFEIFFGVFIFSTTFAAYIMQKPGVATFVGLLTGSVQILMGSPFAATVWISGLIQGAGAEVGFAIFGYKKWNLISMLTAATLATVASFLLAWYRGSWTNVDSMLILARFIVRLSSGLLFTGFISKLLADRLAKVGVLKSYPLGEKANEFTGE